MIADASPTVEAVVIVCDRVADSSNLGSDSRLVQKG